MSDLPSLEPGESWWVGLCDLRKSNPAERMDEDADGAYCWVAVPASSEEEAMEALKEAAEIEELVLDGVEDLQPVSSLDEAHELDENLTESFASYTAEDSAVWGTMNLYEAEAA